MVVLQMGKRKCDEACYDALHIGCHCICHGKNHGLGLEHALQNAQLIVESINAEAEDSEEDLDE